MASVDAPRTRRTFARLDKSIDVPNLIDIDGFEDEFRRYKGTIVADNPYEGNGATFGDPTVSQAAAPLAVSIAGYFPGKRLRKVGDLPAGVMSQWRRWCLSREYVVSAEGEQVRAAYASVRTPMLSLSFTDDEMMSARGIRSLHGLYTGAPIEYRRIAPSDIGVPHIGHFGFFRPQFERTLWPLVPQWLQ